MSYLTNAMLEVRVGAAALAQLADDDGDGVADDAVVEEVRLAAEAEVNSYLGSRYAVPLDLSVLPDLAGLVRSVALDLAEYRLRVRRPPVPAEALRRRAEAIDWLTKAATGAVVLPAEGVATTAARGIVAAATGEERVLTHEELEQV